MAVRVWATGMDMTRDEMEQLPCVTYPDGSPLAIGFGIRPPARNVLPEDRKPGLIRIRFKQGSPHIRFMASSTSSDNFLDSTLLREATAAPATTVAPPKPTKWQARWQAFRHPIQGEKNDLLKRRWESLPPELKLPNQISGQHLTHCG